MKEEQSDTVDNAQIEGSQIEPWQIKKTKTNQLGNSAGKVLFQHWLTEIET